MSPQAEAAVLSDTAVLEPTYPTATYGSESVSFESQVHGLPIPVVSGAYETCKRCLDVVLSLVLLAALSPLMLITAVAIVMTDGGPALFVQKRVGRNGKIFRCFKFRSMVVDAEARKAELAKHNHHGDSVTFKMATDPRITPVGYWIRKLSIDELPQLWNVLLGDMSIVGPRPPVPSEVAWYTPWHLRRLQVRPGLTCIWQVEGRGDIPFEQQVVLDIQYIENRSLLLDAKLILATIPAVIRARGAY